MIVKILNKSSKDFSAVKYNDDKINKGTGELMKMKNFSNNISPSSSQAEVKDYLKSFKNDNIKNKQFHCTLSTEKREHSKEILAEMAERFMDKMGYGKQPYVVVFHNDTDNNHIHIVSTRVNVEDLSRIDRDFERYRSQTAMSEILKEMYGVDNEKKINNLLIYNYSNLAQLEKLISNAGYQTNIKDNSLNIFHNGLPIKSVNLDDIKYNEVRDEKREKQLYSILNRFKNTYSNNVFQVVDQKNKSVTYQSELQNELKRKLGIEISFSHKDDKNPFGYTIIDHKTNTVLKGSDIMKMGSLFNFTTDKINKSFFDISNTYNISSKEMKEALISYLENKHNVEIKDYMVFGSNTKVPYAIYDDTKNIAENYIRNFEDRPKLEDQISFIEKDNIVYLINEKENKIFELQKLVGERLYNQYLREDSDNQNSVSFQHNTEKENVSDSLSLTELLKLNSISDYTGGEGQEDNINKRKKKRR